MYYIKDVFCTNWQDPVPFLHYVIVRHLVLLQVWQFYVTISAHSGFSHLLNHLVIECSPGKFIHRDPLRLQQFALFKAESNGKNFTNAKDETLKLWYSVYTHQLHLFLTNHKHLQRYVKNKPFRKFSLVCYFHVHNESTSPRSLR